MGEGRDNHRRLLDGGDDPERTAALRAVFQVDLEDALEQARPAQCAPARRARVRLKGRRHLVPGPAQPPHAARRWVLAPRGNGSDAAVVAAPELPGAA